MNLHVAVSNVSNFKNAEQTFEKTRKPNETIIFK